MARDLPRSAADDRTAALVAARALERELPNLIAHLTAPGPVEPTTMRQAARVARILSAELAQAALLAVSAAERAAIEREIATPLRSVS